MIGGERLSPPNIQRPATPLLRLNPKQVADLQKKWKKLEQKQQQQRPLLIDRSKEETPKDPHKEPETTTTPRPEEARYESNRNKRVEREQRARKSLLMPDPSRSASIDASQAKAAPLKSRAKQRQSGSSQRSSSPPLALSPTVRRPNEHTHLPPVSALGLAFHFTPATSPGWDAPSAGGQQTLFFENDLPEGEENLLNTRESIYYSFFLRIHDTTAPFWLAEIARRNAQLQDLPEGDHWTILEITLDAEGYLKESRVVYGSGSQSLDDAALDAWAKAPPMSNPPAGLMDKKKEIHLTRAFLLRVSPRSSQLSYQRRGFR